MPRAEEAARSRRESSRCLGKGAAGLYGARDPLGTRGLWAVKSGGGAGSLASDYRLLRGGAALLPPGTVYANRRARRVSRRREEGTNESSFDEAARTLASLLEESVKRRVHGQGRVAVSFSGGLDSSLLAMIASRHTDVVLCSAFASGSRDESQSERAAALLGLKLETALLDEETLAKEVERGGASARRRHGDGQGPLVHLLDHERDSRRRRGRRMILLGQLADELFGGYMKYASRRRRKAPRRRRR